MADIEEGIPNAPSTVFNIGSASKQFTAFAIQLLVESRKISLADDVHKYLPELHDFGYPITIDNLLHQTSGLRDALVLLNLAGWRYDDVMSEQDLLSMIWRQRELNFTPGTEWMYSNTNYILLGLIVSRVSGMSLPQFAEQKIFKPLGMTHTRFVDTPAILIPHRARSYEPASDGSFRNAAYSTSSGGAGNLYTTVQDLQRWYRNFDNARVGGRDVLERMLAPGHLNNGRATGYASGLFLRSYRGARIIEHNGGNPGYRADTLRFPDQRFDVAVLCNAGTSVDPDTLARQIGDVFLAGKLAPVSPTRATHPPEINVDPKILAAYVGNYRLSPEAFVSFSLEGSRLMSQVSGQPKFPLFATSPRDFFLKVVDARVTFDPPDQSGKSPRVFLRQAGQEVAADRISWAAMSPRQVDAYVGDYFSPELNVHYQVSYRGGNFYIQAPRGEIELTRVNIHTFWGGGGTSSFSLPAFSDFQCNDSAPCSDFLLTDNGRTRNLRFNHVKLESIAKP